MHLKGYDKVFVIGWNPGLQNVIHLPAPDNLSQAVNIKNKLLIACKHPDISEDFLYVADDHYLLHEQAIDTYPNYTNGMLVDLAKVQNNTYRAYVLATANILRRASITETNFNIHSPIIYNKTKLIATIDKYEWTPLGFLIKSLYGNTQSLLGTPMNDLKISRNFTLEEMRAKISGRPVFSTGREWQNKNISLFLAELFPTPSKYE